VAVGGAQVEDQITEIAVNGELRLERPAEKKRSLSLTDRTLPQHSTGRLEGWELESRTDHLPTDARNIFLTAAQLIFDIIWNPNGDDNQFW